ncbi:cytochrome c1 [Sulfurovum sp. bin170]|uniref:c-type cytochrome n=1 Tax=Sulfurovum sp. bin170 TaxID=2695268 RepID=UPI0013DFC140|nr:c-type cytochrome [Sulfurovum sp. bin170]NEW60398.1 cytochrome c1 [Sulfurovum sp. bin170]
MNKELKIFGVVAVLTLILYWGVEPFAHGQMHKHVDYNELKYDGKADIAEASKDTVEAKKAFWADVKTISALKGDAVAGEATYAMCMGCHMDGAANMGGVIPPVLDHAGTIYDKDYLIALIKDPAMASNVDHKYADTMTHPMGSIKAMVSEPQDIANVVAYLKANKSGLVTPKQAYEEACGRCHANRYVKWTQIGTVPATERNLATGADIDALKFKQAVAEEQSLVADYMGKLPPDLSMIIRARSHHFLETFIENPQGQMAGTAMPRVGVNQEGMDKVMAYLEISGDPSKPAREALGPWVILFFIIFTVLAYYWKQAMWKDHY